MKSEAIHNFYIYNSEIYETKNIDVFKNLEQPMIYEVIRVINKKPLYLKEHISRLEKSSEIIKYKINKDDYIIKEEIMKLININNIDNQNIKILCSFSDGSIKDFLIYFIKSNYPEEKLYNEGIHTIVLEMERQNPNIKSINKSFKEKSNIQIQQNKAYEALLVNDKGHITEGSRSNIFFVKNDKIYTATSEEILLGVTRDKIIKVCKNNNIEVVEKYILKENIQEYDAVFMSGTSVGILPIKSIGNINYDSVNNDIVRKISKEYLKDVSKNLENFE